MESDQLPEEWRAPAWHAWRYGVVRPGEPMWPFGGGLAEWGWTEGVLVGQWPPDVGYPGPDMYDPVAKAREVFDAALKVDPLSVDSLIAFSDRWGTLGVGTGRATDEANLVTRPQSEASLDTVWATRRAFKALQDHFTWLRSLQQKRWGDLPSLWADQAGCLEAARELVPPPERERLTAQGLSILSMVGGAEAYLDSFAKRHQLIHRTREAGPKERPRRHWAAFGAALAPHLRLVHPELVWSEYGRPASGWRIRRLVDVLWIQLWTMATTGAAVRRCKGCGRWFPGERKGKVYCDQTCANRASSKKWYWKIGRSQRRAVKRK